VSKRPIKVALLARAVFPTHGFGGIERHVFHLVTHLADLGAEVDLWVQDLPADHERSAAAARLLERPQIRLRTARYDRTAPLLRPNSILGRQINYPLYSMAIAEQLAAALEQERYDVVHSQGLAGLGWALLRRREPLLRALPFVANPHGMEEYKSPDWRKRVAYLPFRALYSWTHRSADRAIATDACTAWELPHYLGVDPRRVAVIPSAIDVVESLGLVRDDLRAELRARLGLDQSELTLLAVSRLERNKGYHLLLDALRELRDRLPGYPHAGGWQLVLAGQGKEEPALRAQAAALGLGEHMRFAGRLSDEELHTLYEEVDLFVHPTLYEGSSLVTLEAMVHRRPVVATSAGGIPDKVFSGRNGVLVQPNSTRALANGLQLALQLRDQWPAWGAAGQAIVRDSFDWPVVARRTLALYEELLG
jgi:glycogen(starch) synthase